LSNLRAIATEILSPIFKGQQSLSGAFDGIERQLTERDSAFVKELCFGVCRHNERLKAILKQMLTKPIKSTDVNVEVLLLIGLYQLLYTRVAAHAAINETVSGCKEIGSPWAKGLVNALLRRCSREKETLLQQAIETKSARLEMPKWIIQRLEKDWPSQYQEICNASNERPPMTLRVNCRKQSRDVYIEKLANAGIDASAGAWSDAAIKLAMPTSVHELPGFSEGCVSVQDEGAQLVASLLDIQPGLSILDACAAPGGKTCHILERVAGSKVVALDNIPGRVDRIKENLQRLQLNAATLVGDALQPEKWWDKAPFDRILVDAPCSATGVIRRHPDIKLSRREADIHTLANLQGKILNALWPLLANNGKLMYVTCSVLLEENTEVMSKFLKSHSDAQELTIDAPWGVPLDVGRQLLPTLSGSDGFYYALLQKDRGIDQ